MSSANPLYLEVGRAFAKAGDLHKAAALGVGEAPPPVYAPAAHPGDHVTIRAGAGIRAVPNEKTEAHPTDQPWRVRVVGAVGPWLAIEIPTGGTRFVSGDDLIKPHLPGLYGEIERVAAQPDATTDTLADLVIAAVTR